VSGLKLMVTPRVRRPRAIGARSDRAAPLGAAGLVSPEPATTRPVEETGPAIPAYLVMSKTRFPGAGPNDAKGTTGTCPTPGFVQSQTPPGKMALSRVASARVKATVP
jgi:hypothetical protein